MSSNAAVIITGVSQRLGFYCAKALTGFGYQVIGTYRNWDKNADNLRILEQMGVVLTQADFSSDQGIQSFIDYILHSQTALRAVVHNASSWSKEAEHRAQDQSVIEGLLSVHAIAPYRMNMAFTSLLNTGAGQAQQGKSDIIHITDYVVSSGSDHHIAYAASKAALDNMSKSFARHLAPLIKVNSIAPSLLMFNPGDDEAYRQKALSKSLMGIEPGPDVMAQTLQYLLTNPYLTGQTITLDGGRTVQQS